MLYKIINSLEARKRKQIGRLVPVVVETAKVLVRVQLYRETAEVAKAVKAVKIPLWLNEILHFKLLEKLEEMLLTEAIHRFS